jgi:hypothetical protein
MQRVDEIVLADLTPQALQKRMERGDIYPVDRRSGPSHSSGPGSDRPARIGAAAGHWGGRSQSGRISEKG